MTKKILFAIGAVVVITASVIGITAFEAHVINVTAHIENGLYVPLESLDFGTVFPQEKFVKDFNVSLSDSFIESCSTVAGIQWASSVVGVAQGMRKNGTSVLPDRSDPTDALGVAQSSGAPSDNPVIAGSFFSLGFSPNQNIGGGSIVLGFTNFIVNEPGNDIKIFEVTGGTYPDERITVEVSQDNLNWFPTVPTIGIRDAEFDIAPLAWAKYVRITDESDKTLFEATADAYDLDAVRATSREELCGDISYAILQKPKCVTPAGAHPQVTEDGQGNFVCPEGSIQMPLLCPYLSKEEVTLDGQAENDGPSLSAFHGLPLPWTLTTSLANQVSGLLSIPGGDINDQWNIDLDVPCFGGMCAQDWTHQGYEIDPNDESEIFGCDLWLEVTGINQN